MSEEHPPLNFEFRDVKNLDHKTKVYWRIRESLPGDFTQFSHESLTEMIFDMDRGHTTGKLREDLVAKYKESP